VITTNAIDSQPDVLSPGCIELYPIPTQLRDCPSCFEEIPHRQAPAVFSEMEESIRAVEEIVGYKFKEKTLLEEALTHPSYAESRSYQRLEFVGDAALGLAFSNHVYLAYPNLDPGQLSLLRAANISTEKLARVAVRHGLYRHFRHNAVALREKVTLFRLSINSGGFLYYYEFDGLRFESACLLLSKRNFLLLILGFFFPMSSLCVLQSIIICGSVLLPEIFGF
jgi:hypothetical protein